MNQLYINWKYNKKIVLTTQEIDYHCSIDSVKVEKKEREVIFTLLPKQKSNLPKSFSVEIIEGVNSLEVWTANGKYHQHDIPLPLI